jgi:Seven in absentia protein family
MFTGIRNLAMEKVSEQIVFPCKYFSSGCVSSMSSVDKIQHELTCDYRYFTDIEFDFTSILLCNVTSLNNFECPKLTIFTFLKLSI